MDFRNERFEVEFTEEYIEEMIEIYEYISYELKENKAAKRLMKEVLNRVLNLEILPELYTKIGKVDRLKREYHRIVVKKYIILYTIDFKEKKVYVSHIIYGKRNYIENTYL